MVVAAPTNALGGILQADELGSPRKLNPIKWWAAVGVFFIVLFAFLWVAWLGFGDPGPTPTGPTPIPGWVGVSAVVWQFISLALLVACVWYWVIRPWRRERRISQDGIMCLALMTMYWQDMVPNTFKITFVYNTVLPQWGSWANYMPGWMVPNGHLFAEPLLFAWGAYLTMVFPGMVAGCWIMRKVQARRPTTSRLGLAMASFGLLLLVDIIVEPLWLICGQYSYVSAIKELTVFHGHFYQFPVYEALIWPGCWTMMACLRFFRDDRGNTLVERGIDNLSVTGKAKTILRFLAFAGVFNVLLLFFYNLPMAVVGVRSDPWPADVVERSYFTNGLCGQGTSYACPADGVPIPHDNSAHIGPNGELIVPQGAQLPGGVIGPKTIVTQGGN